MEAVNQPQKLEKFFDENFTRFDLENVNIFFCRPDGVLLYRKQTLTDSLSENSIGALLGGVWQAAQALASFLPQSSLPEIFRLSFDTSSQGIYILPVRWKKKDYYLAIIFHNEDNPGAIKLRLREFSNKLTEYLEKEAVDSSRTKGEDGFLFRNITDEEMNKLFAFAGKL
ncbi:MAG: hypothetical protein WCG27_00575 [Pseudomonadota bacterium]